MTVHEMIEKIRRDQDAEHGGPTHDDTHTWMDWPRFITRQLVKANDILNAAERVNVARDPEAFLNRVLHAGALALAALESMGRKRGNGEIPHYEKLPDALHVPSPDLAGTLAPQDWLHAMHDQNEEAAQAAIDIPNDPMTSFIYRSAMVHIHGMAVACGEAMAHEGNKGRQPIVNKPTFTGKAKR